MEYLKYVGIGILTIFIAYLSLCAFSPNRVLVSQTVIINNPAEEIYSELISLENWPEWHPYFSQLKQDQIEVKISDNKIGSSLQWETENNKGGKITLSELNPGRSVKTNIVYKNDDFQKVNQSEFMLEEKGKSTKVIWMFVGHKYSFFKSPGTLMLKQVFSESMSVGLKRLKNKCEQKKD